ncbi:hypothetical protein MASR2M15_14230 [Anaerolineales bacterium]
MSRVANFCPQCGGRFSTELIDHRLRPHCLQCGFTYYFDPKVAVVIWMQQSDSVLLVQRAVEPGLGKWALPAGFVEWDEAPEEAAVREVQEETGLQIRVTRLLDVFPRRDHGQANIVIAYAAEILDGTPMAADDVSQVGWFTRSNHPEVVFYPTQTLLSRWKAGLLRT